MKRLPFVFLAAAVCAACFAACSSNDATEPQPDPPVVAGVSPGIVAPGDTVIVTGSNFRTPASGNTVTFTNPLGKSTPVAGSSTSLTVLVDQDATTGPVTVSHDGGSASGGSVEVRRGLGDFFVFGGTGSGKTLALPNPTATTRYLIVPHATNASKSYNSVFSYSIASSSAVPSLAAANAEAKRASTAHAPSAGLREAFEAWRWEQAAELAGRVGVPRTPAIISALEAAAPQETRQFSVLNTITGSVTSTSSYSHITAELRYTGTKCLLYTDVDTLSSGNFAMSDLRAIGQAFDNGIDATNVQYFGGYSDIDGNGKVIILISPVVNQLTPPSSAGFIAGFFLFVDLYKPPTVPASITNQGEIFYLLAADPSGQWGNSFEVDFTRDENISTTAHEHQHMISFSHRLFQEGGAFQRTWLEEGMSHMAEDLNGLHNANMNRTALYMANPAATSLENNQAPLEQRGGIYLFLRLMVDRYGTGILKQIVQSKCSGRACVTNVTGEDFYDLEAEFFAALYLSGKGITADPRFEYTSIDLSDYGAISPKLRVAGGGAASGTVLLSAGDFYLFSGVLNTESRFVFTDNTGGARLRQSIVRVQ